jgi:hypothetical protein
MIQAGFEPSRLQWPRGLRHELSSPAQTLDRAAIVIGTIIHMELYAEGLITGTLKTSSLI